MSAMPIGSRVFVSWETTRGGAASYRATVLAMKRQKFLLEFADGACAAPPVPDHEAAAPRVQLLNRPFQIARVRVLCRQLLNRPFQIAREESGCGRDDWSTS
jgi:hypothetical protein